MKRLLLLAAALLVAGAAFAQGEYHFQRRSLFDVLPLHSSDIVFVGNSITDGCEWAELFQNRHVKNRGISGDRSDWLLGRLDSILTAHPKKLFLMIGTNDLAAGRTPDEIVRDVERLIDRFQRESKWTNSGAMSGLNRASAGCFTRMTGSGRRLLRTYSVNALWRRWGVL